MKKIVIAVDPDLIDLIPRFLTNKRSDLVKIAELIGRTDYAALRGLGHKLKGEGGGYGLDAISAIGASLEAAGEAGDLAAVSRCHGQLAEYLDALEIVPGASGGN